MIPKKIHYIWFGGKPEPIEVQKYKKTWQKCMPDWEIIRWDESNFDIHANLYCQQAYSAKKWAFASDYARIKVLYEHGGIYFDTDIEAVHSLERFLQDKVFFGMEASNLLQAGVLGSEKNSECFGKLLEYYDKQHFIQSDGTFNLRVIGSHIAEVLQKEYKFELSDKYKKLNDYIAIYPSSFFCPDLATLKITENSYTIHRPMGSWLNNRQRIKIKLFRIITAIKPLRWLYLNIWRKQ